MQSWAPRLVSIVVAAVSLTTAASASAATISVNTTADNTTAGNGQCTLREAIANVNATGDTTGGDCVPGSGSGDIIKFSFAMPAKIRLVLGELLIRRDVSITNLAPGALYIDAGGRSRVFGIAAGTTSMSKVIIEHGSADNGGGVMVGSGATLALLNCTLRRNSASTLWLTVGSESAGGAIHNAGSLSLTACTLVRNTVLNDPYLAGAGFSYDLFGGGIHNAGGTVTVIDSVLAGNLVKGDGDTTIGGAIYNAGGSVSLTNCSLTKNRANGGVCGAGAGGGISNFDGVLTLTDCKLTGNRANGAGGGIINESERGTVTLTNCMLTGNRTTPNGEGFSSGAGIDNYGSMTLTGCTLSRNSALSRGFTTCYGFGASYGGGIENVGALTMTNCTLAGNRARSSSDGNSGGGGIYAEGPLTLINCTLSGNTAKRSNMYDEGGGGIFRGNGDVRLTNTIIANSGSAGNCLGEVISGGHNLSSDGTCFTSGGTDLRNTGPRLAPLGNYGGPTQTMALCTAAGMPAGCRAASPAIDGGGNMVTGPPDNLTTDQRGLPRLSGAHVDIGAYEVQ